jgi:hypothetical protein
MVLAFVVGVLVGAVWMHQHLTCPACQARWQAIRRALGLRLIE